jgi:cytochrome c-type biogenesis protein CcmH
MTWALTALALGIAGWFVVRPLRGVSAWPAERPDRVDDVARAVSSLRDLEFARAAGTLDEREYLRLRERLEREAFAGLGRAEARASTAAPSASVRSLVIAAALAGIVAMLAAVTLPAAVAERSPDGTMTGTVPSFQASSAELEARLARDPRDIPTRLALAEAYQSEGRPADAARAYQAVLEQDRENVPALNGLALILYSAGERDGAMIAVDRVLTLRPRDPDALFLKGLALYQREDWRGAVEVWRVYLDVGEFHPAAGMVRTLYAEAQRRAR